MRSESKLMTTRSAKIALAPFVFLGGSLLLFKNGMLDDPFITFRYARNLAAGNGAVWNVGGPKVQGYTSILWMWVSAFGIRGGFNPLLFAKLIGALSAVTTLTVILSPMADFLSFDARAWTAAILAVTPVYAFYAVSGMEQPLFCLLTVFAVLAYLKSAERKKYLALAGLALGLSAVTRPEGIGSLAIVLLYEIFLERDIPVGNRLRRCGVLLAFFLVVWAIPTAWQVWNYRSIFPNTFYAKHTGGGVLQILEGVKYISLQGAIYFAVPTALIVFAGESAEVRGLDRVTLFLAFVLLCYLGYILLVGGDDTSAFPSFRLFVPVLPLLYVLVAFRLQHSDDKRQVFYVRVAAATTLLLICWTADGISLVRTANPQVSSVATLLQTPPYQYQPPALATWIERRVGPSAVVALPFAGRVPYYLTNPVIDTLGLNDSHIAHLTKHQHGIDVKMDPDYVLSLKPDLIFINVNHEVAKGLISFEEGGGWKLGDRELLDRLRESNEYEMSDSAPTQICVFQRMN